MSIKCKSAKIIPTMRYKNAPEAIKWLCKAFGFEEHLIIPADDMIAHAQLIYGNSMIMLGSLREDEFIEHQKPPSALEGFNSQSSYIIVEDIDTHYNCAVEAGAKVIIPLKKQDYGGKLYSCKNPEGYLRHFESYNPWDSN